jgi:hypothetical protein
VTLKITQPYIHAASRLHNRKTGSIEKTLWLSWKETASSVERAKSSRHTSRSLEAGSTTLDNLGTRRAKENANRPKSGTLGTSSKANLMMEAIVKKKAKRGIDAFFSRVEKQRGYVDINSPHTLFAWMVWI